MHTKTPMTHPLDHLVLPTHDLKTAQARLGALGFTVAPQGTHPFGTINCCVYFGGDTFLEPLAIGDPDATRQAADAGNVFVGRDRAFRARNGDEGFSAVVFGTDDADADHAHYVASGISAGQRLDFSRPFVDVSGKQDTASFRLAFAAAPDMADAFTFACQRANAPRVDRTALQAHANGVSAIRALIGVSDDVDGKLRLLGEAAGAPADAIGPTGLALPNATLSLFEPAGFERRFGLAAKPSSLRFAAIVFAVPDARAVARRLAEAGVDHHFSGASLVVPAAAGQGAAFVFEESA